MKRNLTWAVFVGGLIVVVGVVWQAFSMAAYVRGAGEGALDAHAGGAAFVHIGQLAIVIGALVAYWGNWRQVGYAVGFLIVSLAQLAFLGDTDKKGDWINGLHGALAIVLLVAGVLYAQKAWRELRPPAASPGAA
jgi:phosphatidylglycerophosphate synthase